MTPIIFRVCVWSLHDAYMYILLTPLAHVCLSKHYTTMYRSLRFEGTGIQPTDTEINENKQL